MLHKIPAVGGELVLAKDECGYQEVVDSIPHAQNVSIVTYNISKNEEELLTVLRDSEAEVRLITNIPGRFEAYYTDAARRNASKTIERTLKKLDPDRFGAFAKILFCFRNHAKIVMTESAAYVGSANYAEESALSWECGILIRDADAIRQLSSFVDAIEADSVRYYGPSMLGAVAPLLAAHKQLAALGERLEGKFTTEVVSEVEDAVEAVRDAVGDSDRAWAEAFESSGPLTSRIGMQLLDAIEQWSTTNGLWELATTNENLLNALDGDICVDELVTDRDGNIPEYAFDGYIDGLQEEHEMRLEPLKSEIESARRNIALVCGQIEAVCNDISTHIKRIKNTSPPSA